MKRIVDAVAEDPNLNWGKKTRKENFPADASAIFESMIAEYGVEAILKAVVNQGFSPGGEYRYAAEPLYEEAMRRRLKRLAKRKAKS